MIKRKRILRIKGQPKPELPKKEDKGTKFFLGLDLAKGADHSALTIDGIHRAVELLERNNRNGDNRLTPLWHSGGYVGNSPTGRVADRFDPPRLNDLHTGQIGPGGINIVVNNAVPSDNVLAIGADRVAVNSETYAKLREQIVTRERDFTDNLMRHASAMNQVRDTINAAHPAMDHFVQALGSLGSAFRRPVKVQYSDPITNVLDKKN